MCIQERVCKMCPSGARLGDGMLLLLNVSADTLVEISW
jgi:hypothetical protein